MFVSSLFPPLLVLHRSSTCHRFELISYLSQGPVDLEVRSLLEGLLTQRTPANLRSIPVSADAGHAEAVAAWCRRRIGEHIQAYGAGELVLSQKTAI